MARMWDLDDLGTVGDIAARMGQSKGTVGNWVLRYPDFPAHLATIGGRQVFSIAAVIAWEAQREWYKR
jgi:hypothetical protein